MCGGAGHVRGRGACAGAREGTSVRVRAGTSVRVREGTSVRVRGGARVRAGGLDNAQLAGTGAPASSRRKRVLHNARPPDNQLC